MMAAKAEISRNGRIFIASLSHVSQIAEVLSLHRWFYVLVIFSICRMGTIWRRVKEASFESMRVFCWKCTGYFTTFARTDLWAAVAACSKRQLGNNIRLDY